MLPILFFCLLASEKYKRSRTEGAVQGSYNYCQMRVFCDAKRCDLIASVIDVQQGNQTESGDAERPARRT